MYPKKIVSPLDLYLDSSNPRFIIQDTGNSQDQIRQYLLNLEDVLPLAISIADNNGLMPGDRIVICDEKGKDVVLEGNRRTCACQLFLNRDLIPLDYLNKYPKPSESLIQEISQIEVDIISSREKASRFLAVRHIEQTKEWSPIAKMRFCFEDFNHGKSISQINERTGISLGDIKKFIKNYKILFRGLNGNWTNEEKKSLSLFSLDANKLLRMFALGETNQYLGLYYDDDYNLKSHIISDGDIEKIIHIWTRKAFIENQLDTRSLFSTENQNRLSGYSFISTVIGKYFPDKPNNEEKPKNENGESKPENNQSNDNEKNQQNSGASNSQEQQNKSTADENKAKESEKTQSGGPKTPPFFSTLNWQNIDKNNEENKGVIAICDEIARISKNTSFIDSYKISTAYLVRGLIEHSLIYHARKNGYWNEIKRKFFDNTKKVDFDPNLGFIIDQYNTNIKVYIKDPKIMRLMGTFNLKKHTDKLNLVVHSPESFLLSPLSLKSLPDEGLLTIINYLLK